MFCPCTGPYANRTDEAARADMVERLREHAKHLAEFVSAL